MPVVCTARASATSWMDPWRSWRIGSDLRAGVLGGASAEAAGPGRRPPAGAVPGFPQRLESRKHENMIRTYNSSTPETHPAKGSTTTAMNRAQASLPSLAARPSSCVLVGYDRGHLLALHRWPTRRWSSGAVLRRAEQGTAGDARSRRRATSSLQLTSTKRKASCGCPIDRAIEICRRRVRRRQGGLQHQVLRGESGIAGRRGRRSESCRAWRARSGSARRSARLRFHDSRRRLPPPAASIDSGRTNLRCSTAFAWLRSPPRLSRAPGTSAQTGPCRARRPSELEGVGVDEHLGQKIDLEPEVSSPKTAIRTSLREYFSKGRPVILNLVYYSCPMLCNLVLNGQIDALRKMPLDPGKEFEVVTISIDPTENYGLASNKKAAYLASYERETPGWHFLTDQRRQCGRSSPSRLASATSSTRRPASTRTPRPSSC